MINRLLQDLQGLQERNAMEVLPEVDKMMEALQNLKNNKLFELQDFASKYGMVMANIAETTESQVEVKTKVEKVVDTAKSEELGRQIIEEAKLEADAILARAKEEANTLIISTRDDLGAKIEAALLNAEMEAEDIRSGAKIEANFIIANAKEQATKEADEILAAANIKVSSIINEALADAGELMRKTRELAEMPDDEEVEVTEDVVEETIEVVEDEVIDNTFDVSDAIVANTESVEVKTDVVVNASAIIKSMEEDRRHKNAHIGVATIGDRQVIFHSAKYMNTPMVYDACEGDEELIREAILDQDAKYFDKASNTFRYVDYDTKQGMYLNADGVYVGYVDGYAVSWSKKDFENPYYLRYKYVNRKGFKPATLPDFIAKVNVLVAKYDAAAKEHEAKMADAKSINRNLNYVVFNDEAPSVNDMDIVVNAANVSDALLAFADME